MSTILQALKRLEKEQAGRAATQSEMAPAFDAHKTLHRAAASAWLRSRATAWSVVALGIGLGVIVVLVYSRSGAPVPPSISRPFQPATDASDLRPDGAEPAPLQAQPETPFPSSPVSLNTDLSHPSVIRPPATKPSGHDGPVPRQPEAGDGTVFSGSDPPPATAIQTSRPSAAYSGAQRLTDGRLTIQAIAWSPNADERMAVINNRVVREGTVVEGFSIIGITEDAVYARESGRLWQVRFGRP